MKSTAIPIAWLGAMLTTASLAQTTTTTPRTAPAPAPTAGAPTAPGTNSATGTPSGAGIVDRNTGQPAASGDRNQAVATTNANAAQPARGANSFTEGEARRRLERNGYKDVTGLQKDNNGVWRGSATKGAGKVKVWLDYKGNVGES